MSQEELIGWRENEPRRVSHMTAFVTVSLNLACVVERGTELGQIQRGQRTT